MIMVLAALPMWMSHRSRVSAGGAPGSQSRARAEARRMHGGSNALNVTSREDVISVIDRWERGLRCKPRGAVLYLDTMGWWPGSVKFNFTNDFMMRRIPM